MKAWIMGAIVVAVLPRGHLAAPAEFVGATPCGDPVRAFTGITSDACQAVAWRLTLDVAGGSPSWKLDASYGSQTAADPGMAGGPHVMLNGKLEQSGSTYRLVSTTGRSISVRQMSSTLIHILDSQNRLMLGNAAASYTLNRSDATDDPGRPQQVFGESYTPQPRATGNTVIGIFTGRSPCTSLLRTMRITLNDGCQRLKWRITLFQDSVTHEATRYRIEGSLHHPGREGTLRVLRGTATDSSAVVYQLEATASEGPVLLWKADDDVLFFLDERKQPLVGTIDFSYTLNRSR